MEASPMKVTVEYVGREKPRRLTMHDVQDGQLFVWCGMVCILISRALGWVELSRGRLNPFPAAGTIAVEAILPRDTELLVRVPEPPPTAH